MEFSWTILAVVFVANLFWVGVMFAAQQLDKSLPPRHSLIPGTNQKFLYMQDWYTMKYGDVVAVPLIVNAFVHLVALGYISGVQWAITFMLSLLLTIIGIKSCLGPGHKPDQGFPEAGKISLQGKLHMPYFGIGWSMGLVSFYHLVIGHVSGPVLWLGLFGAVFYIAMLGMEFKSGNFDSLKKESLGTTTGP